MDRSFERIEDENDGLKAKVEQYEKVGWMLIRADN